MKERKSRDTDDLRILKTPIMPVIQRQLGQKENIMRTCAVCGKTISKRDICNECYNLWCKDGYPDWVTELIRIQSKFERSSASKEEPVGLINDY